MTNKKNSNVKDASTAPSSTTTTHPDKHDSKSLCADEINSMLHLKAEIHRLRAEVTRLKRLQHKDRESPTRRRERRSYSLSSRPARIPPNTKEGDVELGSSSTTTTTTNDRHPSVTGLHHRRHPQELFVSLLKHSNRPDDALVSKHHHSDSSNGGEERQQQQQQPEQQQQLQDEVTCEDESSSFLTVVMDRAGWLAGLLVLQSLSSFIIQRNEMLLEDHAVIIRFLTMLIGAGGNAGNQATVKGLSRL